MQERSDLKALAQELSTCLLNDLGRLDKISFPIVESLNLKSGVVDVDPKCIYALGKTSSLVGHSLLVCCIKPATLTTLD